MASGGIQDFANLSFILFTVLVTLFLGIFIPAMFCVKQQFSKIGHYSEIDGIMKVLSSPFCTFLLKRF